MSAWDGGACARDGCAIKGDAVGLVWEDGVEGVAEQVLWKAASGLKERW